MSLSRYLSPEELQALLGAYESETSRPDEPEATASFNTEATSDDVSIPFLKASVLDLSARVELMEREISLLRSQLISLVQATAQLHPVKNTPAKKGSIQEAYATALQAALKETASPKSSFTPRAVKHSRKKGLLIRLMP